MFFFFLTFELGRSPTTLIENILIVWFLCALFNILLLLKNQNLTDNVNGNSAVLILFFLIFMY